MWLAQGDMKESSLSGKNVGSILPVPCKTKSIKDIEQPPRRDCPAIVWRNNPQSFGDGSGHHVYDDGGQLPSESCCWPGPAPRATSLIATTGAAGNGSCIIGMLCEDASSPRRSLVRLGLPLSKSWLCLLDSRL
ncbi:Hypothetical predicted protein [Olea europaea subsp. europaea]|uniref:Uncharacterized protein n=1 Tax=Olea europaea subsp. europaea TaxID=158383 RepID=A0A8S0QEL7_OLEEU|nr:Hypothetical predicted protein [Olea europaea subsp. europaea]